MFFCFCFFKRALWQTQTSLWRVTEYFYCGSPPALGVKQLKSAVLFQGSCDGHAHSWWSGEATSALTSPPPPLWKKAGSVWSCPGLGQTRSLRCSEEEQLRANSCWCSQSDCGGSASSTHFLKPLCASERKKKRKKKTEKTSWITASVFRWQGPGLKRRLSACSSRGWQSPGGDERRSAAEQLHSCTSRLLSRALSARLDRSWRWRWAW